MGLIECGLDAGGHVPDHRPDVVSLVCAAINHEAHQRGQIRQGVIEDPSKPYPALGVTNALTLDIH